ncbi:hypothetical protein F4778DRAFT_740697 [Xylariomycetidae sp. FL2044]|nr:hypothetical protein F4778DRAFT_740697 [Xylariomycetidae sp. FL2044]
MPGVDPNKIKKNGAGKGNWGTIGDEVADQVADQAFHLSYARRRSNSSGYSTNLNDFKTKFEVNDVEPVFEESIHGPEVTDEDEGILTKTESSSSAGSSVDGKDHK